MGQAEMIFAVLATVVAGVLLFAAYTVQKGGQDAAIDATQYRAAKIKMMDFAEVMQRDFGNMGSHMYRNAGGSFTGAIVQPDDAIENGWFSETPASTPGEVQGFFQFISQPDSTSPPVTVRYEWAPIDGETITLNDGTTEQLYRVDRLLNGNPGGRNDLVTEFEIALLTDTSNVPILFNLDRARVIDVRMKAISPLRKGEYIEETIFESTYRPVAMTITDNKN
ncbi:MAG: hypothetical protein HKN17_06940 [Rhodothermales bacterium]|nr:hypothetical protein [Rhodothermales bacterium]